MFIHNPPHWYDKQFGLKPGFLYKPSVSPSVTATVYKYSDLQNLVDMQRNNNNPFVEPHPKTYTLSTNTTLLYVRNMFYSECLYLGMGHIGYDRPAQNYPIFLHKSTLVVQCPSSRLISYTRIT